MIKVGHSIALGRQCGLFSSARTLVAAERAVGLDAWFVPQGEYEGDNFVGIPCTSRLKGCNVIVNHSGLSSEQVDTGLPIVHILHAQPRYKMVAEMQGHSSCCYSMGPVPGYKAFVTFYPEHIPYWQFALPDQPIEVIDPPVDLEHWRPGAGDYEFGGHRGEINLVISDSWRPTQDPFDIVHAVAIFAKAHSGVKVHFYGSARDEEYLPPVWKGIMKRLQARGIRGEFCGWAEDMAPIYQSADMVLSNQRSANNVMREALACGCQVVADAECVHTQWAVDVGDPVAYAAMMEDAYVALQTRRQELSSGCRAYAEDHFDATNSAKRLVEIITSVYDGKSTMLTSPSVPWCEDGLEFECVAGCSICCANADNIRVLREEIDAIADHLGHSVEESFEQAPEGWRIKKQGTGNCPFNVETKCILHDGPKPTLCKTFPFWQRYIMSERAWAEVGSWCPGVGQGRMHDMDVINASRHETTVVLMKSNGERGQT